MEQDVLIVRQTQQKTWIFIYTVYTWTGPKSPSKQHTADDDTR